LHFFSMHLCLFFFLTKSLHVVFGCTLSTNKMILLLIDNNDSQDRSRILLSNILQNSELRAIPRKFVLSGIFALWPLGMGINRSWKKKLWGTEPCTTNDVNKNAIWHIRPALMTWSDVKLNCLASSLWGFNLETACLISLIWNIWSEITHESGIYKFKPLIIGLSCNSLLS